MNNVFSVKRITKNAIYLALLCVIGMFAIPLGDNVKVSLQLLVVFIIGLTATSFVDTLIITGLYLGLGMFLPIYAGFRVGISPTFGYVIAFVIISFPLYFLNKLNIKNDFIRMGLACFVSLIIVYIIGTLFLMLYLDLTIEKALLFSVVPYIPFDIAKIIIAALVVKLLPKKYR